MRPRLRPPFHTLISPVFLPGEIIHGAHLTPRCIACQYRVFAMELPYHHSDRTICRQVSVLPLTPPNTSKATSPSQHVTWRQVTEFLMQARRSKEPGSIPPPSSGSKPSPNLALHCVTHAVPYFCDFPYLASLQRFSTPLLETVPAFLTIPPLEI